MWSGWQRCVNTRPLDGMSPRCRCQTRPLFVWQLQGFENVKAVKLIAEPFTLENDLLTPTFKLKRNVAKTRFQADIDDLYEKSGMGVVAGKSGLKQGAVSRK